MKKLGLFFRVVFLFAWLAGCSGGWPDIGDSISDQHSNVSQKCANCHNKIKDQAGSDVSYVTLWSGSLHANAGIDPYFQATVSREINQFPALKEPVESTCSKCHIPLARQVALERGQPIAILNEGAANPSNPMHTYLREGVACIICHQISPEGLGTLASFSGGFRLASQESAGGPILYGPFDLPFKSRAMMENATGTTVQKSEHLAESELCAVCHTLYTSPVNQEGKQSTVKFPEQVPYLEWKQSSFASTNTCQSCHLPPDDAPALISNRAEQPRSPMHPHTFIGSNVYMLNLLRSDVHEKGSLASPGVFDAAIQRTTSFLANKTASLAVSAQKEPGTISITVRVTNLSGHKLPTAYPSRRVWLHLIVQDKAGGTVFESGSWQADGAIRGNENDADPTLFEPHYNSIQSPDQVQIYEAILANLQGEVTTGVVEAAGYLKDNRLLPAGFDKNQADPDTAVVGEALRDYDFTGGEDKVLYQVQTGVSTGPFTVRVELVYQSIGYRWLLNLGEVKGAELERLQGLAATVPNTPVVLATEEIQAAVK